MHGLGNKILVVDLRGGARVVGADEAKALTQAHETEFDQLMAIHRPLSDGTDALIRIYNSDGSPAGACGNGMRCVGLVLNAERAQDRFLCEVGGTLVTVRVTNHESIAVDMGRPKFDWQEIPLAEPFADTRYIELQIGPIDSPVLHSPSVLNMGNPHAIFWVDDPETYELDKLGPLLENHPIFPDRANITLAAVEAANYIRIRTWERGAGLTQACGSAACAAAVAAARTKRAGRTVTVRLPGGELGIDWQSDDRVVMTGPAAHVRHGELTFDEGPPQIRVADAAHATP